MTKTVKMGTSGTAIEKSVDAGTYYINATTAAENLYINGTKVTSGDAYSFTVTSGKTTYLRFIVQDGTKRPFIKLVEFTGK